MPLRLPVIYALKQLGASRFFQAMIVVGALMGMISSLLVFQYGQTRIWFAMSRDGLMPKLFSALHPQVQHAALVHLDCRTGCWHSCRHRGHRAGSRSLQHRHAVCICVGRSRSNFFAQERNPTARAASASHWCHCFPIISVVLCVGLMAGLPGGNVDALLWLAGHWFGDLFLLQPPSQRIRTQLTFLPAKGDGC